MMHKSDDGWMVFVEVEDRSAPPVDGDAISRLGLELDGHGGVASSWTTHGRFGCTFSLYGYEGAPPWQVLRRGVQVFEAAARRAGAPAFDVVWAEVMTFAEQDRQF